MHAVGGQPGSCQDSTLQESDVYTPGPPRVFCHGRQTLHHVEGQGNNDSTTLHCSVLACEQCQGSI